jgi:hypothetical protein
MISTLLFWGVFAGLLFVVRRQPLLWPLLALGLLLLFNQLFTPGFFDLKILDGHLYGTRIDILNHGAKVMLRRAGHDARHRHRRRRSLGRRHHGHRGRGGRAGSSLRITCLRAGGHRGGAARLRCLLGAWNGLLVAGIGIQPIVATLILMVAGRGIAQLITDGQIINFDHPVLVYLGNGHLLGLPFTLTLVLVMLAD